MKRLYVGIVIGVAFAATLGVIFLTGGTHNPEQMSIEDLTQAAENGDQRAAHELGQRYEAGKGVTANWEHAAKWYRVSAKSGYVPAQYMIGHCYEQGTGVDADASKAIEWYRKAAESTDSQHTFFSDMAKSRLADLIQNIGKE